MDCSRLPKENFRAATTFLPAAHHAFSCLALYPVEPVEGDKDRQRVEIALGG